jgi:hypothetical protein
VSGTHTIQAFAPGQMRFSIATGIENRLPWMPDMVFRVDLTRLRSANSPNNTAIVRHVAPQPVVARKAHHKLQEQAEKSRGDIDYLETVLRHTA